MAITTHKSKILLCNDTTANWAESTKVLLKGEVGIEITDDAPKFKVGDGINTWEDLAYVTMTPTEIQTLLNDAIEASSHSHENKEILDEIEVALTEALKLNYDAAYEHSVSDHAPTDAEANIIETITVNSETLEVADKSVNIVVPVNVSDLENDAGYLTLDGTIEKANSLSEVRLIDGVAFDGTGDITHYGTCSTTTSTAAKTIDDITNFSLVTGSRIAVKFTYSNSANSPTLNVNGTGAISIMYHGSTIDSTYLEAGHVYEFIYDGTNYEFVGDISKHSETTDALATARSIGVGTAVTSTAQEFDGTQDIEIPVLSLNTMYLNTGSTDTLILYSGNASVLAGLDTSGGSSGSSVFSATNTTGWLTKTIASGTDCSISITWSSVESGLVTGSGTLTVTVNSVQKISKTVSQGSVSVDLTDYLSVGSNTVKVKIADVYGSSKTITYTVTVVSLSITSSFDVSSPFDGEIIFTYIPTGSATKTVYFIVDGETIGTATVTTSGRQQSYTIPAQDAGSHTLLVYFTAEIDGETVESNQLYYEFACTTSESTDPIITTSFDATEATQYDSIVITYYVYVPNSLTASEVILAANGEVVNTLTNVDRTEQTWTYRATEAGELVLTITCGDIVKTITLTVIESEIGAESETADLVLYLSSYGRSNSESDPSVWEDSDNGISATLTDFNYTSDGWQTDDDGVTVLRVSGDARVEIPLQIFASDFRSTGKTIEIEFETRDVRNYDSEIFSCMSDGRGLSLTAQAANFASEQTSMTMQYKEDEHVRLSFVIEKRTENRIVYAYINGIISGTVQYPTDDDFSQISPVNISIGTNDCTTDIYCIRVYDNDLTRYQVLDNWIADTQNGTEMLERYLHNDVYDDYGSIVISQLPTDLPYLVLVGDALPTYKGNKLTISGYYINPEDSSKDFTFDGATIDVQGTSSAGYARKNYKIKFSGGFTDNDGNLSSTYAMRDDSIATKTFTFKADVASSEGCNNVELVRLYNDICVYQTPPQTEDSSVRQGIDGFPIVIFWDNGTDVTFLGKYNFNNDKGTEEVYGFEDGDESWEILNNTSDRVLWKNDDFSDDDWLNDFEARYPEDNTDVTNLSALSSWLVSTDQTAATNATLSSSVTYDGTTYTTDSADYRLAKFKAEFEDYLNLDDAVFYYVFTELFLMVDSRAKNAFPTRFGDDAVFCWFPYDFDTAIGINNEGALAFSYNLEDIDSTDSGADIYNGQQSVLWVNLRQAFYSEITAMYQQLRSDNVISYDIVEAAFEEHQAKWPEAIFNEDAYYKYIEPLINDGTASYLSMCQGSKEMQRKWWLYNRFKYMDSKYNAGDALSDIITLRGYAKDNITVTPYADIYAAIKYGSYLVQTRATRNESYTLECPLSNVNDTEIYIYSSSQLADVGDLSGLMVGYADFSNAIKLLKVKIGDSSDSYSNGNLTELYLGNNTLLQVVDSRNCPSLAQSVDLSGCTGIEEVYFTGTSIPSVSLPNGGVLKVLYLPGTITNLTIRNQSMISDFQIASTSQITTLRLENVSSAVDSQAILSTMVANSRVRLIGIDWEFDDADEIIELYDILDTMRGLDENGNNTDGAQVSGTLFVDTITGAQLYELQNRYPDITITYNHVTSNVYFYNYDGSSLLYTVEVSDGGDATSPGSPSRSSTAQYTFTFVGWSYSMNATSADSECLLGVTADRYLYAAYSQTLRYYTVYFYNGSTLLETYTNIPYGGSVTYSGDTSALQKTDVDDPESYEFSGWSPSPSNITGNTSCYAQYNYTAIEETLTDYTWEDIIAACEDGTYKEKFSVGDTKIISLGTEGTITMQIAGFDKDTLADGSGTAPITWIGEYLLATSHRMNPSLVTNYDTENTGYGWYNSTGTTYRTRLAYRISETTATWVFAAAEEDGTKTFTYAKSSSSNSYSTLSLTVYVNGEATQTISASASTSTVTVSQDVVASDVLSVTATFNLLSASYNYYATLVFTETPESFESDEITYNSLSGYDNATGAIGGWESSEMRTYIQETIYPLIPEEVSAAIKTVTKSQTAYNTSGSSYTQTTEDAVWIPSYPEMFGSSSTYYDLFQNTAANRIKYKVAATSASYWWLRTAYGTYSFYIVYTSGFNGGYSANYSDGVALGFCI